MAPLAPPNPSSTASLKRQRSSSSDKNNHYEEIANVQHAQIHDDALASPPVQSVFDRLLDTLALSESSDVLIKHALRTVKKSLDAIAKEPVTFAANSGLVRKLVQKLSGSMEPSSLFHSPKAETVSVACHPPPQICVVGSYLLGYCTAPVVDVAVEMPRSLFNKKDCRNYLYHDKRLLYLLYLANHFLMNDKHNDWVNISISSHHFAGDLRKPLLSLSHSERPSVTICIVPCYPVDMFELSRLGDDKCNIPEKGQSSQASALQEPTPVYNQSIIADATPVPILQAMHKVIGDAPKFKSSLLLLYIWSKRHHLRLSKFILASLLCDLYSRSVVSQRATKEQVLRCALSAISAHRLRNLTICGVRVCVSFSSARLNRIAKCASRALSTMENNAAVNDPWAGVIPRLFTTARGNKIAPHPISTLFDGFLKVTRVDSKHLAGSSVLEVPDSKILSVLQTAFVDTGRLTCIEPLGGCLYGLTCTSYEDIVRKVDIRNDSTNADTFNSFWGEMANLRRFKHGKIIEALVWSGGNQTLQTIAQYVFDRHFKGILLCTVVIGKLEEAAKLTDVNMAASRAIVAFNELSSLLRSIDDLPLKIRDVNAVSPHLRRCGMFGIRPNPSNSFVEALGVLVTFESSKAWPKDIVALAASKAGFYVALKGKLAEKGVTSQVTVSYMDITLGGCVFRVQVHVDIERELTQGKPEGVKVAWETEMVVKHHENIRNIGSMMVGQVCRLAKRWLNTHMLFGCLGERGDVLVELLVMAVFYDETHEPPGSTMSAFCRFLHLLAEFPWEVCPLVISIPSTDSDGIDAEMLQKRERDENTVMTRSEQLQIAQRAHDVSGNAMGIFVARGDIVEAWNEGHDAIEATLVKRIQTTAMASLQCIEQALVSSGDELMKLKTAFTCGVSDFDAIVHIDKRACVMSPQSKDGPMGVRHGQTSIAQVAAGLDPVERVWKTINERLTKWAIILRKVRCGTELYIVWRPVVREKLNLSLRDAAFCDPVIVDSDEKAYLKPSIAQLVNEIKYLGQGLVTDVELLK